MRDPNVGRELQNGSASPEFRRKLGRSVSVFGTTVVLAIVFAVLSSVLPVTAAEEERHGAPGHVAPPGAGPRPGFGHPGAGPGFGPGPHDNATRGGHAEGQNARARYAFQGHDVRRFNEHDIGVWRGGAWHHEYHNGRYGYWWFAGGAWYLYDTPVYPYPIVVSDTYYEDPEPVVEAPPPQAPLYYCDNPPGYYPQVASCYTPFRAVAPPPVYYAPPQEEYPPQQAPQEDYPPPPGN